MDGWLAGWVEWMDGWVARRKGWAGLVLPACRPAFSAHLLAPPAALPRFPPQVGKALGQDLDAPAVQNMMAHAAAQVLGWGSGAGRHAGARLARGEFKRLMDHFRVV